MANISKEIQEERFRELVSILIASVTILAAVTTFLQTYAAGQAADADRLAQEFSVKATTKRVTGLIQVSSDWEGVFQTWQEIDMQAYNAQLENNLAAAERYQKLQDRMTALSPLLNPPYFDPEQNWTNYALYESDLYIVEATRLSEKYAIQAEIGNAWDVIANGFVIQLTLLAVTLSLFGLSSTIKGWVRWLFIAVGSSIIAVNLAWMAYLLLTPLPSLSDAAIEAYSLGVGLAYQDNDQEAINLYNEALDIQPNYANAYFERAYSYFYQGDYEQAARDYESASSAGRSDYTLGWNLGWTYYLLGYFDQAITTNQQTLSQDPTLIGLRMNQGLALLASGNYGNADVEYTLALQEAARQVSEARGNGQEPPSSLWYFIDAGATDLQSLVDTLNHDFYPWNQAPPVSVISADPATVIATAQKYIQRIREASITLELSSQLPTPVTAPNISPFEVGLEILDEQGNFQRYEIGQSFPGDTLEVIVLFDYAGMKPDHEQIWRVFLNGLEDLSGRVVSNWSLEESGEAIKRINTYSAGDYIVELYIEYQLVQTVRFSIEE